jgi:hypothetical protein
MINAPQQLNNLFLTRMLIYMNKALYTIFVRLYDSNDMSHFLDSLK